MRTRSSAASGPSAFYANVAGATPIEGSTPGIYDFSLVTPRCPGLARLIARASRSGHTRPLIPDRVALVCRGAACPVSHHKLCRPAVTGPTATACARRRQRLACIELSAVSRQRSGGSWSNASCAPPPLPRTASSSPSPPDKAVRPDKTGGRAPASKPDVQKLFVLDTNVLMHDPTSLFRFEEHDIYLPMFMLEELDAQQEGRHRGRAQRAAGVALPRRARDDARAAATSTRASPRAFRSARSRAAPRPDACTCRPRRSRSRCRRRSPTARPTTRSSRSSCTCRSCIRSGTSCWCRKDINMRIKARALGLSAEDYFNDKVLEDTDLLYSGMEELPADFWDRHGKGMESWQQGGHTLVPADRSAGAVAPHQRVRLPGEARRVAVLRDRQGDPGQAPRVLSDAQGVHAPEEQRLGHHGAQPRAELRAQPADESGGRLRHAARPGGHRARRCSRSRPA